MTQATADSPEFLRFFSLQARGLLSYRRDGTVHLQRPGTDWTLIARKNPELTLAAWIDRKLAASRRIPAWCLDIDALPTLEELEEWSMDSIAETPTGHSVEPDGVGPDGVPSWLRCLGLI